MSGAATREDALALTGRRWPVAEVYALGPFPANPYGGEWSPYIVVIGMDDYAHGNRVRYYGRGVTFAEAIRKAEIHK